MCVGEGVIGPADDGADQQVRVGLWAGIVSGASLAPDPRRVGHHQ
jgi:hypothetical protein